MTITTSDIKILEPERLTDTPDGGGQATGRVVVDGQVNNLFDDISRVDRDMGDFSARKCFFGPLTDNDDLLGGVAAMVRSKPTDPNVHVAMVKTDSYDDVRADAVNRIESYLVASGEAQLWPFGDQYQGQSSLSLVQEEQHTKPSIGDVLAIIDSVADNQQFVRIVDMIETMQTFSYVIGDRIEQLDRRVLSIQTSTPLDYTFTGGTPSPVGVTPAPGKTAAKVMLTRIAGAAKYYSATALTAPAEIDDDVINVQSIFTQLVPAALTEQAITDQHAATNTILLQSGETRSKTISFTRYSGSQSRSYAGGPIKRGDTILTVGGGTYRDINGSMAFVSGTNVLSDVSIDYATGQIDIYAISGYITGNASLTYTPAGHLQGQLITDSITIAAQNIGYNYTLNLAAVRPQPGSLKLYYISQGKWYELRDDENGALEGEGSGTVDYVTGSVYATLTALPDADTALVYQYASTDGYQITRFDGTTLPAQPLELVLETGGAALKPGSVQIDWTASGQAKSASAGLDNQLTGDATGTVNCASGLCAFLPAELADDGAYEITFQTGAQATETISDAAVDGSGVLTGTIASAPVRAGSVEISYFSARPGVSTGAYISVIDDGAGNLFARRAMWGITPAGTIDYSTGAFAINAATLQLPERQVKTYQGGTFTDTVLPSMWLGLLPNSAVKAKSTQPAAPDTAGTQSITLPPVSFVLHSTNGSIAQGSVLMDIGGVLYRDRDGVIERNFSSVTDAGEQIGTIDYNSGAVALDAYAGEQIEVLSGLAIDTEFLTKEMTFRTPGIPVRLGSLQLYANRADSNAVITGAADNDNIISGSISGSFDNLTGIAKVVFAAAVKPSSVRYNCVIERVLPVDSDLIGIDPVRLPVDGRVAFVTPGDILVIHHQQSTDIGTPAADQTVDCGRVDVASFTITDSLGARLKLTEYSEDRELGTITFGNPLTLVDADDVPLTPPLTLTDTIEHRSRALEVEINGTIKLEKKVPRSIPVDATVSSLVVFGDKQARVKNLYSQRTWDEQNPNWTAERIGSPNSANYNQIDYPIVVTNAGTSAGRWACVFSSTTDFSLVSESLGVIAQGSTSADLAPLNPRTGKPYFTIQTSGWGSGWQPGNVLRFDTEQALVPLWITRTIMASEAAAEDDSFEIEVRGDSQ